MAFGKRNEVKVDIMSYTLCLLGQAKVGKEQPVSEPVLTENGWVRMGDIKVGDRVYGEDGNLYNVTGVYPQGIKDVYKVTFRDGTSTRCGLEHLWTVQTPKLRTNSKKNNDYRFKVLELKDIINDYKKYHIEPNHVDGGFFSHKYSVPINNAIKFEGKKHVISSMALGLLLGDGGFTRNVITFTNSEDEIFNCLEEELKTLGISLHSRNFKNHKQSNLVYESKCHENPLRDELRKLGLIGCGSREKFIPKEYIYDSVENRIDLLSGLVNTDGNVKDDGCTINFSTYSKRMCDDIAELARSLGFICTKSAYNRTNETSTKKYEEEIEYRVRIIGDDFSILKLSKKHKGKLSNKKNSYAKTITNIELVGTEESQCIMIDNPNHLYITNDYIVTHNTTLIKNVCDKLDSKEGSALFVELGSERGADAIQGINYINCPNWDETEYNEYSNSIGFETLCEDIIANKSTEYKNLRVLIIDTYDQYIDIAINQTIKDWNKECKRNGKTDKIAKTINQTWGGFAAPSNYVINLMFGMKSRLKEVGVEMWFLGHVKRKEETDFMSNETYQVLTSDQQQVYFNRLVKDVHILGLAYIDRMISREKTGKKNIVTGKEEIAGKVKAESRRIKFRDDSYAIDSGVRFGEIVSDIDLDADQFIKAITDAIKAEQSKSGKSYEEAKKEQEELDKIKEERIAQAELEAKAGKNLEKIINKIVTFMAENKTNMDVIKPILTMCKENNASNPKEITDIKVAEQILEFIETF